MHRDVQSDNEARRRANIGNRQVSSRRAGSITLHCSQNLAVPLPVAVIGNNIIKRHSPRGVQSLPLVKFLPLSTRNEPSRRSQAKADQPPGTWAKAFTSSTNPRVDTEITVAKTEPIAARGRRKFSQRKSNAITSSFRARARHPIHAPVQITFGSLGRQLSSTLPG